jgi:hypothetical protein
MQTLKAPQGITGGVAVGGQFFAIDDAGHVQVPDAFDATQLFGLGFVAVAAKPEQQSDAAAQ